MIISNFAPNLNDFIRRGREMLEAIVVIVAIFITAQICKVLFRNTIGTTTAYAARALAVFFVVIGVLAGICTKLGII